MSTEAINRMESHAARAFYNACHDTFDSLAARWEDEKEYEDIADCIKPIKALAGRHGVTILGRMSKSPFSFRFICGPGQSEWRMKATKSRIVLQATKYMGQPVQ